MFEEFLSTLKRIATALETIAGNGGIKAPADVPAPTPAPKAEVKKAAPKAAPKVETPPPTAEVDFKEVQQVAIKYVGLAGGKPAFTAFLKKHWGVEKISDRPDAYAEMLAKLNEAIAELEAVG